MMAMAATTVVTLVSATVDNDGTRDSDSSGPWWLIKLAMSMVTGVAVTWNMHLRGGGGGEPGFLLHFYSSPVNHQQRVLQISVQS